jgi:hypothetical protein
VVTCQFADGGIQVTFANSRVRLNATNKDLRPVLKGKMA